MAKSKEPEVDAKSDEKVVAKKKKTRAERMYGKKEEE